MANDYNVLYMAGNKEGVEHLFLNRGLDLENHSEPFKENKETKINFARYDLFFDIAGKIDIIPKKFFKQSFRGEFYFTRKEQFSIDNGCLLNTEIYFSIKNVVQIVDSQTKIVSTISFIPK